MATSALAFACATRQPEVLELRADSALFFEVEGRRPSEGAIFLLGSIHVGRHQLALGPVIERAYARSELVVLEIDLSAVDPVETLDWMQRYGALAPLQELRELLSPETYAELARWAERRQFPLAALDRLEPWCVWMVVMETEVRIRGFEAAKGVDMYFAGRVGDRPVAGLETLEEQLAVLDSLPLDVQEALLRDTLDAGDTMESTLGILERIVNHGDPDAIALAFFEELDQRPELGPFFDSMIFERNRTMSERLEAAAADGRTRFVVVGALHLVGERGIPTLLAQRGFRVHRRRTPPETPAPNLPAPELR